MVLYTFLRIPFHTFSTPLGSGYPPIIYTRRHLRHSCFFLSTLGVFTSSCTGYREGDLVFTLNVTRLKKLLVNAKRHGEKKIARPQSATPNAPEQPLIAIVSQLALSGKEYGLIVATLQGKTNQPKSLSATIELRLSLNLDSTEHCQPSITTKYDTISQYTRVIIPFPNHTHFMLYDPIVEDASMQNHSSRIVVFPGGVYFLTGPISIVIFTTLASSLTCCIYGCKLIEKTFLARFSITRLKKECRFFHMNHVKVKTPKCRRHRRR